MIREEGIYRISVSVVGDAPLLMNKYVVKDSGSRKKNYVPAEEAERVAYRNAKKKLFVPSSYFEAAMAKAGSNFSWEGKKRYKEFIKSGVFIEPQEIILKQQKYQIFEAPVTMKGSGGTVLCWRPMFGKWSCSFIMKIVNDELAPLELKKILVYAGKYLGVGAWRPKHGRFHVVKFKKMSS